MESIVSLTFEKNMKNNSEMNDELRPEYDMKQLLQGAVRGKYAKRYAEGTNLVLLADDVAEAFPTAEAVNEALRLVLRLSKIPATEDKRPTAV
jgi:hypothetical protein